MTVWDLVFIEHCSTGCSRSNLRLVASCVQGLMSHCLSVVYVEAAQDPLELEEGHVMQQLAKLSDEFDILSKWVLYIIMLLLKEVILVIANWILVQATVYFWTVTRTEEGEIWECSRRKLVVRGRSHWPQWCLRSPWGDAAPPFFCKRNQFYSPVTVWRGGRTLIVAWHHVLVSSGIYEESGLIPRLLPHWLWAEGGAWEQG